VVLARNVPRTQVPSRSSRLDMIQTLFAAGCAFGVFSYVYNNIDSIKAQQAAATERAITQQRATIESVQEKQRRDIEAIQKKQRDDIARGRRERE
jgi:hypothetical protein